MNLADTGKIGEPMRRGVDPAQYRLGSIDAAIKSYVFEQQFEVAFSTDGSDDTGMHHYRRRPAAYLLCPCRRRPLAIMSSIDRVETVPLASSARD